MVDKDLMPSQLQRLVCDCADELRDYWLFRQSKQAIKELMALSASQQRMIRKVWRMTRENPEGIMLKDLADKLSLSSSAVSVMVDAMVKRGILIREVSPDDRRKVMIRISRMGLDFSREYEEFFEPLCSEFIAAQDPEEMQSFMNVLENLNTFLYKQSKEM